MRIRSRRGPHALVFALVLMIGGVAVAADPNDQTEIYLNSEFMVMNSFGTGVDAFEIKLEETDGNSSLGTVGLDSDTDFGWRGDLQLKKGAWGFGVSGFHFDNDVDEEIFVPNDAASHEVSVRYAAGGVECMGRGFEAPHGDCLGAASSEWKTWMVDLYAIRELVSTPDVAVDLQAGLRIASFDWETSVWATEVEDPVNGRIPIADPDENVSFVDSSSDLDDPLVGPFLSLLATGRFGRFQLEGQLSQAVVFGAWDGRALFSQYNGLFLDELTLEEQATLGSSKDLTIPITDVRLKLGFEIIDNLVLGVGGYATTWFNVPRPPNSIASDRSESLSTFQTDEENITLIGATFSLSYRFGSGGLLPF